MLKCQVRLMSDNQKNLAEPDYEFAGTLSDYVEFLE